MAEGARALAEYSRLLWEKGWVANHDGNLSVRRGDGLLATPTSFSKRAVTEGDVLVLDAAGKVIEGRHRVFSEISLHVAAYEARPDARAVIHAHPTVSCGFAVAGVEVDPTITPEAVVSLGDRVPLLSHHLPGAAALLEELRAALASYDAVLFASHGVLTVGDDLEQAFLRAELVEHLARIQLASRQLGRTDRLAPAEVAALLEKRAKAGLGPTARAKRAGPSGGGVSRPALAALIADEVRLALRGS